MYARTALAVSILSFAAGSFAACGGENETIPPLEGDSGGPPDTSVADTSTSGADSSGADTSSASDTAPPADATPSDVAPRDTGADIGADDAGDAGGDVAPGDAASDSSSYDGGPLNGCSNNYVDRSTGPQAQRTITAINEGGALVYDVPCMHIKRGQTVEWDMDLTFHPLAPLGGTEPTPITLVNSGATTQVVFPNPGTYGFHCLNHVTMVGAIQVP
jgi:plastocyanin